MITFRVISPVNAAINVRGTPCKFVDALRSMRSLALFLRTGSCAFFMPKYFCASRQTSRTFR